MSGKHRKPVPSPAYLRLEHNREHLAQGGVCIVCEGVILRADGEPHRGRRYCSGTCRRYADELVGLYRHHELHTLQRILVGIGRVPFCKTCGEMVRAFEVDHIKALALVDRDAPDAWKYWSEENLQVLCHNCHAKKTVGDIALIKARRRGINTDELF